MDSTQRLTMERERNLRVGAQLQESQSQLQQADQTLHDARAQVPHIDTTAIGATDTGATLIDAAVCEKV